MKVLVIEDDAETCAFVAEGLRAWSYQVESAADGIAGLVLGADPSFGCLVVDRMLPGHDSLTLVRALRTTGVRTPIIFLTAVGGVADRVQGLRAGADDYLVKPFAVEELAARVDALARRRDPVVQEGQLRTTTLQVDRLERTARMKGCPLELTVSEFKILETLLLHLGRPVTKAMLVERVFGLDHPGSASLIEPHMSRLRGKLDRRGGRDPIRTVRGLGYLIRED